jgi:hypothetical protein
MDSSGSHGLSGGESRFLDDHESRNHAAETLKRSNRLQRRFPPIPRLNVSTGTKSSINVCISRLANQHLIRQTLATASEIVRHLGAVQAQEYSGAKWGIAQRTRDATDAEVEKEISDGKILRTHVLRPTWHFVVPEDIRWMLALSAPRTRALAAHYDRKLGIDTDVLRRSRAVLTKTLRDGKYLTRRELADALTRAGVRADGTQRLAHLMIHAELDGVVCSGPRRGKQFTYALMDERVPPAKNLERDAALHTLAKKYFTTRGPATADDFSWWSGLTKTDAKAAVNSLGSDFASEVIAGRSYWFRNTPRVPRSRTPIARLLPTYDEYLVSYADRSAAHAKVNPSDVGETFDFLGSNVITIDGQIVGRWKRETVKNSAEVALQPLTSLTDSDQAAIDREIAKFNRFVGTS